MPQKIVLIVDDENAVRFTIAEALRCAGYQTCEATSSEEALRLVRSMAPDLIICDVHIETDADGFRILAEIRREPQTASLPFILITGGHDSAVNRRGMENGANDFLVKPFSPRQLVASVDACLNAGTPETPPDRIAPHRLLDMVNDVPMLVGTCDPVSTRFEFLNRFGMSMLHLEDAKSIPRTAFSEICVIANEGQSFAETWAATRRHGAWAGTARLRTGGADHTQVLLALTAHQDPGSTQHYVTVLARNLTPTTNRSCQ